MMPDELAAVVARIEHEEAVQAVDWSAYRRCGCGAATGQPCRTLSSAIVNGRPDGVPAELVHAHVSRQRRTGRD